MQGIGDGEYQKYNMHLLSDSRLSDLTGNSWLVAVGSGIFLSFLFGVLVCLFPSSFFLLILLLLILPLLLLKPYFYLC